jgi:hypothetical protein
VFEEAYLNVKSFITIVVSTFETNKLNDDPEAIVTTVNVEFVTRVHVLGEPFTTQDDESLKEECFIMF